MDKIDTEFGPYLVRHIPRDPTRLIVIFNGAGVGAERGRIEEFGATVLPLGVSACFVQDRDPRWLGHDEAPAVLNHVAALAAGYDRVGALGASMGASSAIAFAEHGANVDRVLAIAPQFSMSSPFAAFDHRFRMYVMGYPEQLTRVFDAQSCQDKVLVLYGTEDWRDLVHAGLYAVYGYEVGFIDGADHVLTNVLKRSPRGNLLAQLGARFADFSAPFGYAAAAEVLGDLLSRQVVSRDRGVDGDLRWRQRSRAAVKSLQKPPAPEGMADLTRGAATDQSSVSRWSRGTTAEDSAGAISGAPTGGFGFHTDDDDHAWWSIDFGEMAVVRMVRIYNRLGALAFSEPGVEFVIEAADGGSDWREVFRKADLTLFGGVDGRPFVWTPQEGVEARRLRIRRLERGPLHYDQIEIFGDL